jgi:CheY-like chemotaxis protein
VTSLPLSGYSILCVDNYVESLELLKFVFEAEGAKVFTAVSSEDALRIASAEKLDLMIADIRIPDDNGIVLLNKIRSLGIRLPAIAITGVSDANVRDLAISAGFLEYLVKPVDEAVLSQAVLGVLRSTKSRAS